MTYQEEGQTRLRRLRSKQAIALAMEGQWREAVSVNQDLIESFPNDVDAHNRLGRAYMELGEYAKAREAYSRALEIDPYNTIAEKNLRRLSHLGEAAGDSEEDSGGVEPQNFIEEIGKAGVVNFYQQAPLQVLARVVAGDRVYLKVDGANLVVEDGRGVYLGRVEPRHGQRLIKLIEGGNRYSANIISSTGEMATVIIREVYQDPSQWGQQSFPTRGVEVVQPYAGDRMVKREPEDDEESAEEPDYTIVDEDGEAVVDDYNNAGDKADKEK